PHQGRRRLDVHRQGQAAGAGRLGIPGGRGRRIGGLRRCSRGARRRRAGPGQAEHDGGDGGLTLELDAIDALAARAFEGYVVCKDLVQRFKGQYPVPTYVVEFLLGRYCASVDEDEIAEGLQIVERQLADRTVRAGEKELFKARAREK